MSESQIQGISYYLPKAVLSNEMLAALYPQWTAASIEDKTGIRCRHIAGEDETASDMAVSAARDLFASGKAQASEVDFVLFCTQSPDHLLPTSACLIQHRLGVPTSAGALDINLGCSGYVYGLMLAQGLIATGVASRVLLLTADTYSKMIHPMDRSVRTLFGDAATATIIRATASAEGRGPLLGPFVQGTDGAGASHLIVPAGGFRMPSSARTAEEMTDAHGNKRSLNHLSMNGPAILTFTMAVIPRLVETLLCKAQLQRDNVDLFVFHQANLYVLNILSKQCKLDPARFVIDLENKGNTVSSTIPIALADAMERGSAGSGTRVMLVGFGVGLSWAAGMAVL